MAQEIQLSQIGDRAAFETAVAAHIERLKAFANEIGTPRPVAHPLVETSIKRISYPRSEKRPDDYVPDYVIIDDTPVPIPTPTINIADKKRMLLAQLRAAETAAVDKILPMLKQRLYGLKVRAAMLKPVDERTSEDNELIAENIENGKKLNAIELAAAEAEAALADLTEDNVDSWQVPELG